MLTQFSVRNIIFTYQAYHIDKENAVRYSLYFIDVVEER